VSKLVNIYKTAREKTRITQETVAEQLELSSESIRAYEQDKRVPPFPILIKMAEIYNSPELLNNYCCNVCPIGKITISPIHQENINNIYKLSINIFNILGQGNEMGKMLLDVVEDGRVTEDEKPVINHLVENLKNLSGLTNDLVIALEKIETKEKTSL
jgi:DNA-binding XRE family transcriptional regulator